MLIIGLDAASQYKNFGFSVGRWRDGIVTIESADLIDSVRQRDVLATTLAPLLRETDRALLAIDAPLGWPARLGSTLALHQAGERLSAAKREMFYRETDRFVRERVGKKPLDVGADKIALAAYTAVETLDRLRELSEKAIPLAWTADFGGLAAIEVYPSATLKATGLPNSGYKDTVKNLEKRLAVRRSIVAGLRERLPQLERYIDAQDDVFDACLCLVAAQDFLERRAMAPADLTSAKKEGWIWVRQPDA